MPASGSGMTICCIHVWMGVLGALIGVGQFLLGDKPMSLRRIFGRALVSGGLGGAGSALLIVWPDMSDTALLGIACALASLGTSGIEKIIDRILAIRAAKSGSEK